eukprot:8581403-Alexandrium_andersonii.AAC.1
MSARAVLLKRHRFEPPPRRFASVRGVCESYVTNTAPAGGTPAAVLRGSVVSAKAMSLRKPCY